jgi:ubiquinone/menaquinone biosynthesis C-methylase UbiE
MKETDKTHINMPTFHDLYRDHIIIELGDSFYGVPLSLGSLEITEEINRPEIIRGNALKEVKDLIGRGVGRSYPKNSLIPDEEERVLPMLVEGNYKGFRIFYFDTRYFAILKEAREFDIDFFKSGKYTQAFVAHTIEELKLEIEGNVPGSLNSSRKNKEKALLLCNISAKKLLDFLENLNDYDLTLLMSKGQSDERPNYKIIEYKDSSEKSSHHFDITNISPKLLQTLRENSYDLIIIPFEHSNYWSGVNLEILAAAISKRLMLIFTDGKRRFYKGEEIRRISYNKAYLNSMLKFIPTLRGKKILEIGCSDGLACDLLLSENPEKIIGVDAAEIVGCVYNDPRCEYLKMDAHSLLFGDKTFDLCYSIATLEHCRDPRAVLNEMKRVTKRGGYCYVQAGPLYYSPFGHHMFGYFDDYPWIHLRMTPDQIIDYCRRNGIDKKIQNTLGRSAEDYVHSMLNKEHINENSFEEYGLLEFMEQKDIEVINFSRSWEGENLLTTKILAELPHLGKEKLICHGFELVSRVK